MYHQIVGTLTIYWDYFLCMRDNSSDNHVADYKIELAEISILAGISFFSLRSPLRTTDIQSIDYSFYFLKNIPPLQQERATGNLCVVTFPAATPANHGLENLLGFPADFTG